jgi:hypothetical protein
VGTRVLAVHPFFFFSRAHPSRLGLFLFVSLSLDVAAELIMEAAIARQLHGRVPAAVHELTLDNTSAVVGGLQTLLGAFTALRTLSLNNTGLATLDGFPHLPHLTHVRPHALAHSHTTGMTRADGGAVAYTALSGRQPHCGRVGGAGSGRAVLSHQPRPQQQSHQQRRHPRAPSASRCRCALSFSLSLCPTPVLSPYVCILSLTVSLSLSVNVAWD